MDSGIDVASMGLDIGGSGGFGNSYAMNEDHSLKNLKPQGGGGGLGGGLGGNFGDAQNQQFEVFNNLHTLQQTKPSTNYNGQPVMAIDPNLPVEEQKRILKEQLEALE